MPRRRVATGSAPPTAELPTVLLGVVGSFVGGFGGYLLFGFDEGEGAIQPGGIIGSIAGAVVAVLVWRAYQRRK